MEENYLRFTDRRTHLMQLVDITNIEYGTA